MEDGLFIEMKSRIETRIPEYDTAQFGQMRDKIRRSLKNKESEMLLLVRGLKILVLGDWNDKPKRTRLDNLKRILLQNGLYAETIDNYYDPAQSGGLSQIQVFETCCVTHQLIVFIDGEGAGTITEQNYLAEHYIFHGKVLFFIEGSKFDKLKGDPSSYIKSFPTIFPYLSAGLPDWVLVFARLRIYRLADIIFRQARKGLGLGSPLYRSWNERLRHGKR